MNEQQKMKSISIVQMPSVFFSFLFAFMAFPSSPTSAVNLKGLETQTRDGVSPRRNILLLLLTPNAVDLADLQRENVRLSLRLFLGGCFLNKRENKCCRLKIY